MDKILSRPAKDLHKDHGYLCNLVEELCLQHGESVDPGESLAKLLQKISNLDTLTYISHKYIDRFVDHNGLLKLKIDIKGLDIPTLSILLFYVNEFPTSDRIGNSLSCKRPSHVACCANCSHACTLCTLNVCKVKCCVENGCDHLCQFCGMAKLECEKEYKVCCCNCNECRACAASNDTSCDLRKLKDAISDIRDQWTKFDASTMLVSKTQGKGKEDQLDEKTEKSKSWDKVVEKFVEKIEEIADEIKEDRETRATSSSSGKKKPSKQSNAPKSSDDTFEEMKDAVKDELEKHFKDQEKYQCEKTEICEIKAKTSESFPLLHLIKGNEEGNCNETGASSPVEKISMTLNLLKEGDTAKCLRDVQKHGKSSATASLFSRQYKQNLEKTLGVKEGSSTYKMDVSECCIVNKVPNTSVKVRLSFQDIDKDIFSQYCSSDTKKSYLLTQQLKRCMAVGMAKELGINIMRLRFKFNGWKEIPSELNTLCISIEVNHSGEFNLQKEVTSMTLQGILNGSKFKSVMKVLGKNASVDVDVAPAAAIPMLQMEVAVRYFDDEIKKMVTRKSSILQRDMKKSVAIAGEQKAFYDNSHKSLVGAQSASLTQMLAAAGKLPEVIEKIHYVDRDGKCRHCGKYFSNTSSVPADKTIYC